MVKWTLTHVGPLNHSSERLKIVRHVWNLLKFACFECKFRLFLLETIQPVYHCDRPFKLQGEKLHLSCHGTFSSLIMSWGESLSDIVAAKRSKLLPSGSVWRLWGQSGNMRGGGSFMPLLNLIGSKTKPDSKCKLGRKYESKCQRSSQEFPHCCRCTVCIILQFVLLNALCFSLAWFVDERVSQEVNKQQQFDSDFISCSKSKYYTFLAVGV